jgi:hypothetical protein
MTISAKLVDINGLEFAVSAETDTIDIGGFSDSIQAVEAITAQFSDLSTMQANSGLRIGMIQLKINTAAEIPIQPRDIFIESLTGAWSGFVGQETSGSSSNSPGGIIVFDFESIDTQGLTTSTNGGFGGAGNGITLFYEYSDDDISYVTLGSVNNTDGDAPTITNWGTITWRYVRITHTATSGVPGNTASTGLTENVTQPPVNNVTVKVRSSVTLDTADGSVIIDDQLMTENSSLTFDTDLLLTGNSEFVTLEIVSQTGNAIPVTLSEITSIKEV